MLQKETKITLVMSIEEAKILGNFIHNGLLVQMLNDKDERYLEGLEKGLDDLTMGH